MGNRRCHCHCHEQQKSRTLVLRSSFPWTRSILLTCDKPLLRRGPWRLNVSYKRTGFIMWARSQYFLELRPWHPKRKSGTNLHRYDSKMICKTCPVILVCKEISFIRLFMSQRCKAWREDRGMEIQCKYQWGCLRPPHSHDILLHPLTAQGNAKPLTAFELLMEKFHIIFFSSDLGKPRRTADNIRCATRNTNWVISQTSFNCRPRPLAMIN